MNLGSVGSEPVQPPIAQCRAETAWERVPRCRDEVRRRIGGIPRGSDRIVSFDHLLYGTPDQVRAWHLDALRVEADEAHTQWQADQAAWRSASDALTRTRIASTLPLGGGLALSGLLGVFARRRRERRHELELSTHHLVVDGRSIPVAEIESIRLHPEELDGWREFVVRPDLGRPVSLRLDALAPELDDLEAWLTALPSPQERLEERRQISSMEIRHRSHARTSRSTTRR